MFIFSLTAAILAIASFVLAFFIYITKSEVRMARYLGLSIFFFGLWLLGNTKVDIATTIPEVIFYNTVLTLGISLYITFFAFFIHTFLHPKKIIHLSKKIYYLGLSTFFVLFAPTKYGFSHITIYPDKPVEEMLGPIWLVFFIFYIAAHVSVFYKLQREIRRSTTRRRNQAKYILLGSMLAFFGGLFFDLVLPLYGELRFYNLGPQFSVFFIGFTSYAMLRHQLLDIKIVIQRSLIYTILVACITLIYITFLIGTQVFIHSIETNLSIIAALFTALIGIFTVPGIERTLQRLTDKILFQGKYDYSKALHQLSEITNRNIDKMDLMEKTADQLKKIFRIDTLFIFLPHEKIVIDGYGIAHPISQYPSADIISRFIQDTSVIHCEQIPLLLETNTILSLHEKESINIFCSFCLSQQMQLGIPLCSEGVILGVVLLGTKQSGETYSAEDKRLLKTFSHQLSVSLEKARLYEQVHNYSVGLEEKIKERTERIVDLQKRQTQMLLDISHGLQTPLTVMKGEIERLPSIRRELLYPFERSLNVLSQYTTDMLTLARMESHMHVKKNHINVSTLVDEIIEYFTVIATQQDIIVKSTITPNLSMFGNARQLQELVRNLLSNSIKYIDNKKVITITVILRSEEDICISVSDTGIGIPEKDLPHLFERFYRVQNQRKKIKGTGLGLAICSRIVKNHKGTIIVSSTVGKGTEVRVCLPRIDKQTISLS